MTSFDHLELETTIVTDMNHLRTAFSSRLGRELTDAETSFVEHVFRDGSIAARSWAWTENFEQAVISSEGIVGDPGRFLSRWSRAFSAGYQELFGPDEALSDIIAIEDMAPKSSLCVRVYRHQTDPKSRFRFKLYHRHEAAPLADVLSILEHLGLKALVEEGFAVHPASGDVIWIHEFLVDDPNGEELVLGNVARPLEEALVAIWTGATENDGFNRLVLELGASWREAALVRALCRYRRQSGLDPSQRTQIRTFVEHTGVASLIIELFKVRFDPDKQGAPGAARAEEICRDVEESLQGVKSLGDDRVLRRAYQLVLAIKRTNFYQVGADGRPKPYISFKIASPEVADLPEPKPFREIFVCAPNVEGVHLRFGKVARGGLRWSDRHDDFRAEVLGLVKAQQVKNAVIVPVGAKGGFVVKGTSRSNSQAFRSAGVRAYKDFLNGMLDLTDNLAVDGRTAPPDRTVVLDEEDSYLVVAADKGTAAFSDIANEVSIERGYWLGDAFASGGSAGYDHKAMAITARGAWEAIKRHFREIGKDIAIEPFTAVGVGDMSGDVFGNGMLLSRQTRLVAAFDHRDIFIDPDPDPKLSWAERKRLFELPGSSWQDYDRAKLSAGGMIVSRAGKSVELTDEASEALGLQEKVTTPVDLMRAILGAPVELLYLGGIGTYVKARSEANSDAGDKTNDQVRVNGADVCATIVGEGANLGFTQSGRIEFARKGGRINTDAIDNSAGVQSSDLEVNIKILLAEAERLGSLSPDDREPLLRSMTSEVAEHVLSRNYSQTLALTMLERESPHELQSHATLLDTLEQSGRLNRDVEQLPHRQDIEQRGLEGKGLTRPELAVMMAYAKLNFFDALVESCAPDDPHFEGLLKAYFPKQLDGFEEAMRSHRLRREIIATELSNDIIDMVGATFPTRLSASCGDGGRAAIAIAAATEIFGLRELWAPIHRLDGLDPADVQLELYGRVAKALRSQAFRIATHADYQDRSVDELISRYRPSVEALRDVGRHYLVQADQQLYRRDEEALAARGAPRALASGVCLLDHIGGALQVADLAREADILVDEVARLHNQVGAELRFHDLYRAASGIVADGPFDRAAIRQVRTEIEAIHLSVVHGILKGRQSGLEDFSAWAGYPEERVAPVKAAVADVERSSGPWTLGKLIVTSSHLRRLAG